MKLQSVTVQHDPAEDRIALFARQSDTERLFLITRRLTFGLLGALGKQIQKSQGDQRLAQAGLQDELLSMKHHRALNHVRASQADRPVTNPAPVVLPASLLTRIEIRNQGDIRLLIFSDANGEVASIALDSAQVHWFIGRLAAHCEKAGWGCPIPVPGWLATSDAPEVSARQRSAHLVH